MKQVFHIARKEFREYFTSVIGYVFLTLVVFITGFFFWSILSVYATISEQAAANPMMGEVPGLTEFVFGNLFHNVAIIVVIVTPLITMRLLAEERRQHTLELLMTSPVSSGEIVVGKFLGSVGFFIVALILTLHYPLLLMRLGTPDLGPILTAYLGALLLGSACIALGLMVSSLTQHQIAAAIIAFVVTLTLWALDWIGGNEGENSIWHYLSMSQQYGGFVKGFVKLESIVFYLSFIVFFLFATQQRLETMRRQ